MTRRGEGSEAGKGGTLISLAVQKKQEKKKKAKTFSGFDGYSDID